VACWSAWPRRTHALATFVNERVDATTVLVVTPSLPTPRSFAFRISTYYAPKPAVGMKRREFISLLASATAMSARPARAQQQAKLPIIGFFGSSTASAMENWMAAFTQRLNELGWIEGRSVAIQYRWAEGRKSRYDEIAHELVRLKADVIVTHGTPPTEAAKQATAIIPIVFAAAADPVGSGLVASLARPGGNITGLSLQQSDIVGKKLELLREVVTGLRRLAVLGNLGNPATLLEIAEVGQAAGRLGLEIVPLEMRRAEDIAPAIAASTGKAGALYVSTDPLILTNIGRINALAMTARMPTIYNGKEYLASGGLMSYGPNYSDLFRRSAEFVDKILRGAKPGDVPVEQPIKFDLVINLTSAKALNLIVPPTLLARADEVIE
jgi:putative tryptophan/tyrosine transport system substrate-binding protein